MSDAVLDPSAVAALAQLAAQYWAIADGKNSTDAGELFTTDGRLILGPMRIEGRSAISGFFEARARQNSESGRHTRHFAANPLFTPISDGRVRVDTTVLVFSGSGNLPLVASAPSGIGDFADICARDGSGRWRYEERAGRSIFVGGDAPAFAR